MKQISNWLHRISNGWVALSALAVFVLFSALILPAQAARAGAETGNAGSPDTSFYYSPADLYRMAEAYGQQGREAYVRARFTFDLIWPLVYALFLSTAISWVYSRAFTPHSADQSIRWWQRANVAPLLGALFDYLENLSTATVMLRYPDRTAVVEQLAPVFTVLKWVFVNGSFVLLLAGVAIGIWQWSKKRSST